MNRHCCPILFFPLYRMQGTHFVEIVVNISVIILQSSTMQESNMYPVSTSIELFLWASLLLSRHHLCLAAHLKTLSHYVAPYAVCRWSPAFRISVGSYYFSCGFSFLFHAALNLNIFLWCRSLQALVYRLWSECVKVCVCHCKQMVYMKYLVGSTLRLSIANT